MIFPGASHEKSCRQTSVIDPTRRIYRTADVGSRERRIPCQSMDVGPVLDRVVALTSEGRSSRGFVLVGIGGRGGAGKTTLAHLIPEAQVVSTDEFWDGAEFELSRLRAEVIEPLLRDETAEYRAFDWESQRLFATPRVVQPRGVIVIEGVCALHTLFRQAYDLRIWVDAPRELRLARGIARDGEEARRVWETQWMPGEDRYVQRDDPISAAHLIVDGSS
jgi:uridine kinase